MAWMSLNLCLQNSFIEVTSFGAVGIGQAQFFFALSCSVFALASGVAHRVVRTGPVWRWASEVVCAECPAGDVMGLGFHCRLRSGLRIADTATFRRRRCSREESGNLPVRFWT